MTRASLLRLHRWIALLFGLPLLAVIGTGLVLSVEPLVATAAIKPGTLSPATLESLLQRHDAQGGARGIALRPYENAMALLGARPGGPLVIDLVTGEEAGTAGFRLSGIFSTARQLHERLLLGNSWLVVSSTAAMLVIIAIGIGMGLPQLRNTLSGWHQGTAWLALPLVLLSPLTGLLVAFGMTLAPAPEAGLRPERLPLAEAVRQVGKEHDLAATVWIRSQGGRMLARINEGGEQRVYAVTREGLVAQTRNWPRLVHEGTFSALWGSLINFVTSTALLGLLGSGMWMWARRRWRRFARRHGNRVAARSA
jgi:uncharacterized iron-regulated membrane protein